MTTMMIDQSTDTKTATHACACGCGSQIGRKSTFAPGHDAKMVSAVVAKVVRGEGEVAPALRDEPSLNNGEGYADLDIAERIRLADEAIASKFGKPLATKFDGAVHTAWERYDKPTSGRRRGSAKPAAGHTDGVVKVGRWEYPAKRHANGTVVRLTTTDKRKGGDWVPVDEKVAASFRKV